MGEAAAEVFDLLIELGRDQELLELRVEGVSGRLNDRGSGDPQIFLPLLLPALSHGHAPHYHFSSGNAIVFFNAADYYHRLITWLYDENFAGLGRASLRAKELRRTAAQPVASP